MCHGSARVVERTEGIREGGKGREPERVSGWEGRRTEASRFREGGKDGKDEQWSEEGVRKGVTNYEVGQGVWERVERKLYF